MNCECRSFLWFRQWGRGLITSKPRPPHGRFELNKTKSVYFATVNNRVRFAGDSASRRQTSSEKCRRLKRIPVKPWSGRQVHEKMDNPLSTALRANRRDNDSGHPATRPVLAGSRFRVCAANWDRAASANRTCELGGVAKLRGGGDPLFLYLCQLIRAAKASAVFLHSYGTRFARTPHDNGAYGYDGRRRHRETRRRRTKDKGLSTNFARSDHFA